MTQLAIDGGRPELPPEALRTWPVITEGDRAAVRGVLDAPAGDQGGPDSAYVRTFERDLGLYLRAPHVHGVASGTDGLRIALVAAGVRPGDEVIVPALGWPSAGLMVLDIRAVPIWADITPDTWTIDVDHVEALITERTRAIMPVHVHGLIPRDHGRLLALARKRCIPVVEDACQAMGATHEGRHPGSGATLAVYSLNVQKPLQGGSGGVIATADPALAEAVHRYAELGAPPDGDDAPDGATRRRGMRVEWRGITSRLPATAAALASSQLPRLDGYLKRARMNGAILTDGLRGLTGIRLATIPDPASTTHHLYRIAYEPDAMPRGRDWLMDALRAEGVPADLWQERPTPSMPVFGREPSVWTPDGSPVAACRAEDHPVADAALTHSVVIGRSPTPLQVQPPPTVRGYVRAIRKVWGQRG